MDNKINTVIEIDKIEINEILQQRTTYDKKFLSELGKSMEQNQIHPILVARKITGEESGAEYTVICGHQRLLASKEVALKTIRCEVIDEISIEKAIDINIEENVKRKDFSTDDICLIIKTLTDKGVKIPEIAKKLGFSERKTKSFISVMKSAQSVGVTDLGAVKPENIHKLEELFKKQPKKDMEEMLRGNEQQINDKVESSYNNVKAEKERQKTKDEKAKKDNEAEEAKEEAEKNDKTFGDTETKKELAIYSQVEKMSIEELQSLKIFIDQCLLQKENKNG